MYKYSKQAEAAFFQQPVYSFLFACFSQSEHGQNFTDEKIKEDKSRDFSYISRMKAELSMLSEYASKELKKSTGYAEHLDAYLMK
jgi:hypothetical protein